MVESDHGRALDELLNSADREIIESLVYDAALKPTFEFLKSCLIWEDERPRGLSKRGNEFLRRLWVARSFIHQGLPREKWGLAPSFFVAAWDCAQSAELRWPGFQRVQLNEEDAGYYRRCLEDAAKGGGY